MRNTFLFFLAFTFFAVNVAAQCPTVNISYAGTPFCITISSPQTVTISGTGTYLGGTYSSTAGLTIDGGTGAITPSLSTAGTYTVTYTIAAAGVCPVITATTSVVIVGVPSAPVVGVISQPGCTISTGSVALSGLPAFGTWTVTSTPNGITATGTGTTGTISNLPPSTTYTFTVTNYAGCISSSSGTAVIQAQPLTPSPPVIGTIIPPTCLTPSSVTLTGLPAGSWTLFRYPGGITTPGNTTSITITGLLPGQYNFTVQLGTCTSGLSADATVPSPPAAPSAPVPGTPVQPTCSVPTGSVPLSGLPASGVWTVTISPGGTTITGSGTTATFTGISAGTYTFSVTASNGCTSSASNSVVINAQPATPAAPQIAGTTQPTCATATGSILLNSLPSGNWIITMSPGNVTQNGNTSTATFPDLIPGTYSFTVTNSAGCTSVSSQNAVINPQPASPATPVVFSDCALGFGHAVLTVTSPLGLDLQYSLSGGTYQASPVFSSIANGNYYMAVRNSLGCTTLSGIFAVNCGCVNAPTLALSLPVDSTCGTTPLTLSGNTFGGSATSVNLTTNGAGALNASTFTASPFSFTYTPAPGDRGKIVIITVTTDNPLGAPCSSAVATFSLSVNELPNAPVIGTITPIPCAGGTASVVLNGLPSLNWIITRSPDNILTAGSGSTTTATGLNAGTYTFTVTSEAGCVSPASASVVIAPQPQAPPAPLIDTIINPTCSISTGTVNFSGLPATGSWFLTQLPGGVSTPGTGTTASVSAIPSGTYTFTVTNAAGCVSSASAYVDVKAKPPTPTAPSVGKIISPTCQLATGGVILFNLPSTGTWTLTMYPGTHNTTGTGTSDTINGLSTGTYNFTVTNQDKCTSVASANVVIPPKPLVPSAPIIGTITQPTLLQPTGSVVLNGLPPSPQSWIITRLPDSVNTAGSGPSYPVTALSGGVYTFTVTNASGCTSPESAQVTISTPGKPTLIITDPPPACAPGTVDLTATSVTAGSTTGLTYTFWTDELATIAYLTPATATAGTYYIKGTTITGFFNIKPVTATVLQTPVAHAGPDQVLPNSFSTTLAGTLSGNETGIWRVIKGEGAVADTTDPTSQVTKLSQGDNLLVWYVSNGACPVVSDTLKIKAGEIVIPTLITPNKDNMNEYFLIQGIESLGKTELIIFDRRGFQLFRDPDYDKHNDWDGVDYNKNPLPNDTYFYLLKPTKHEPVSGYIMIRR